MSISLKDPPYLLVATPVIKDPLFAQSVVLILQVDQVDVIGLILNRQLSHSCEMIAQSFKVDWSSPQEYIYQGGPVQPNSVWFLHQDGAHFDQTPIMPGLSVSRNYEALMYLCKLKEERLRLYVGYSRWSVSQLEEEYLMGAWVKVPASPHYIFDLPLNEMWEDALLSAGIEPLSLAGLQSNEAH